MTTGGERDYRLETKPRVERQMARLGKRDYRFVKRTVRKLAAQPRPPGTLKLDDDSYRVRQGNWRIFYEIDDNARLLTVTNVLRRNERTYRDL